MQSMKIMFAVLAAALLLAAGCDDDTSGSEGEADATADAARGDTNVADATADTGGVDLGTVDTGTVDTGTVDTGTAERLCSDHIPGSAMCEGNSVFLCVDTNQNGMVDDGVDEVMENNCDLTSSVCTDSINNCLAPAGGDCIGVNSVTRTIGTAACPTDQACEFNWVAGTFACSDHADITCNATATASSCQGDILVFGGCDPNGQPIVQDCSEHGDGGTCEGATCRLPVGGPCSSNATISLACADGLVCTGETMTNPLGTCSEPE